MFGFHNFKAYQKASELFRGIQKITANKMLNPATRDQLHRCSMSVVLNIAEGSGRNSVKERRRFFNIARSSLFECMAILDLLKGSYVGENDYQHFLTLADEISRILYSIIRKPDLK